MKTQLYLTPADHGRALTLDEFTSTRAQEGYLYEIIHGRLEVSPLPHLPHDVVRKWLERVLDWDPAGSEYTTPLLPKFRLVLKPRVQ